MPAGYDDNKSEAPTQRRRDEARREGNVVNSPDLASALAILAGGTALAMTGYQLGRGLLTHLHDGLGGIGIDRWTSEHSLLSGRWLLAGVFSLSGVVVLAVMATGILSGLLQSGWNFSPQALKWDWNRLSLMQGFSRIASKEAVMRGVWAVLKLSLIFTVAGIAAMQFIDSREHSRPISLLGEVTPAWQQGQTIILTVGGALLALGAGDYLFRWFQHEQKLRMSREELKQEHKDDQGDPQLKAQIKRRQKEVAKQRSLADVPTSTVVLTNPTHFAIALRYSPEEKGGAPRVVSKGADGFARRITQVARKHGVPVLERKPLARALFRSVEIGQEIPWEFYQAVAEILAHLHQAKQAA